MSDNVLRYIPVDPQFQPSAQAATAAQALLSSYVPQARLVLATFKENPTFFDPGANWSGVNCPSCGADAEPWWGEAMSQTEAGNFTSLVTVAKCCGASVSLNELHYVWPAAFGRFALEAMNPNMEHLSPQQLAQLSAQVGCPLREIVVHI